MTPLSDDYLERYSDALVSEIKAEMGRRDLSSRAALLITTEEYAEAEQLVGDHPGALAQELGVTRRLVLAWRRWYDRHGRGRAL